MPNSSLIFVLRDIDRSSDRFRITGVAGVLVEIGSSRTTRVLLSGTLKLSYIINRVPFLTSK
jgi:hypothetical protein